MFFKGTGTHSSVYKATMESKNNAQVAVKLVDLRGRGEYIERFMPRELSIIPRLDHANIVAAYAVRARIFCSLNFIFNNHRSIGHLNM